MSNCDDLQQQLQALKEEMARLGDDMDRTERVSRMLAQDSVGPDGPDGPDPVTKMWREVVGVADSPSMAARIRRGLGERETPMGVDGKFQNYAQLGDRLDQVKAEEMGAFTEALLGNWADKAPGDFAWVTSTTQPEQWAGWIAKGYQDFGLGYDAMLQAATANTAPFMRLVENGTRLRVLADLAKNNLIEDIGALRGFMQEAGVPAPAELGRKFMASYKKALILERHYALARRRGGQWLQSLQKSIAGGGDTPELPDIWKRPELEEGPAPLGLTGDDFTDDTIPGKVLQLVDQGPDGVQGLAQLELDIRIDSVDPQSKLDELWRSPAARRDLGLFKDAWLWNEATVLIKSAGSNRVMDKFGVARTAIENGPLMAPFGTKLFHTTFKDRLEGAQIAWEANQMARRSMKLGFKELYWDRFLDGNTPFANDITMHGKPMDPSEELAAIQGVLRKPIENPFQNAFDPQKNLMGDEGLVRDVRDKFHAATKLTIRALLKKATGVDLPVQQAFRALAVDDNVVGTRMFRFKMYNDLLKEGRRNGFQLGLLDEATGLTDTDRLHQWAEKKMADAVYLQVPSEQNLIDFRQKHGITPDIADDETLRGYIIKSNLAGHPVLADEMQQGAWDYAQKLRFQNTPTGGAGGALYGLMKGAQKAHWTLDATVAAFPKIPVNSLIFDFATGMGPVPSTLKYLNERLHGRTPTAAQTAEVEAAWVTSAFLATAFFALDNDAGKLTGNGPIDPKARQEWQIRMRAEGRVPNSILGIPISLGGVPLLNTMFMWKDVKDAAEAAGASDMDKKTIAMGFLQVLTGVIVRQTPLAMFQRVMELVNRGDEDAIGKFNAWVVSGQFNTVSGPTRMIERWTGSTSRDFFQYPKISAADQQLMDKLPQELEFTQNGLKNLLVTLQPLAGRIAGVAYRQKDWLGRAIHLPEGLNQEDHPSGVPGFYTSPVHRELEKQQLLDPPGSLLTAHLDGVPLSPEAQQELNGYIGSTEGAKDFAAQRVLNGRAFTYSVQGSKEAVVPLPNGEKMRFTTSVQVPTQLVNVVQRSIQGRTVYQALNHLIRSPEYKALQANPLTSSNPEVRDLPPAARLEQPGPWMIKAIKDYYERRGVQRLEASGTGPAKEYQALRTEKTRNSMEEMLKESSAINGVFPAR